MSAVLQTSSGTGCVYRPIERDVSEGRASLQQAVRTLRAIRQRYEIDRARNPDARALTVQVALGHADMCWVTAAIEVLEASSAGSATDAAGAAAQARPET